ncbi:MAG TPA: dienelactone hydrolase family protein [Xanthobacteraceae bacterium]|nr:dienelactone hydrolase family protein [Xanthobacteraceae bacterium]
MTELPRITQEMINLYDEFTHQTNDRADFMRRLTELVGTSEAAQAIAAMIAANMSAPSIVPENDSRLKSQMVTFGDRMTGYLVWPASASGRLPAVMVVHENRGLVPHIKDVARRLALEGFLVLAPDFLAPMGGTPDDEDKGRDMIGKLEAPKVTENAVAAVRWLKGHEKSNGKVGAVGFCWGGGVVNRTAVAAGSDLAAAVPYYGAQPPAENVSKIKAELLLHYAGEDERINAGIPAYKDALAAAGVKHEIYQYPGTQHAFNNDTTAARYNKEAADKAWGRTVAMLKRTLS